MKKSISFTSRICGFFIVVVIAGVCSPAISFAQNVDFQESMNGDLFAKLNVERQKNNLPELKYYFIMQNVLDQVAEGVQANFCHCFGDTYVTETLYNANSVDEVIADLTTWKNKKDNPIKRKDVSMVTIGVSEDDKAFYYVIRTF